MKVILTAHCLLLSILFLGTKAFLRSLCPKWKKKEFVSYSEVSVVGGRHGLWYKRWTFHQGCAWCVLSCTNTTAVQSLKVCNGVSGHLSTLNQTVGGNVPGQWIAIAHTTEALRLCLVWVKHVPKILSQAIPYHISGAIPKSQFASRSFI